MTAYQKAEAAGVPVYAIKEDRSRKRAWGFYAAVGKEIAAHA